VQHFYDKVEVYALQTFNNRRKRLNYKTPLEVFSVALGG